mgnify:CR=1 FL=1|jgi:hypothetical protein
MDYYKISKDYWSTIRKFENINTAQTFADSLGEGYTAEYHSTYTPPSIQDRLIMDMQFGQQLVFSFVEDNRIIGTTQEQNDAILVKFRDILAFAQTGAINSINVHLPNITTDVVFTQERKDKYIQMVTDYLSQFS